MAHAFFAGLLAGGVGAPERERGRFRSYLLGALKHFLSKHRAAAVAEKRGAGAEHVALTTDTAADLPLPAAPDDALAFDCEWAFALIARALGLSETAVKVAIHRLRTRFRELIRAEVAATVGNPADAPDELRHLISIASAVML